MKDQTSIQNLITLIKNSHSPFHCCNYVSDKLTKAGFEKLSLAEPFQVRPGAKYIINAFDSTCFAVVIGEKISDIPTLRMITSHTDWPTFLIKPNPECKTESYGRLNTEPYGGMIYTSWLDRPLGIAGKICVKTDSPFDPKVIFFDSETPIAIIPGLAIHMDRNINDGFKLNPQTNLLPLTLLFNKENTDSNQADKLDEKEFFLSYLAEKIGINKDDILDYELNLYNQDESSIVGMNRDFLSAPRLDNITSVSACLDGIMNIGTDHNKICISAFYNNEEIGSSTKQGADGILTFEILERIFESLHLSKEILRCSMAKGLCLSFDVAHGMHPGFPEKNDTTNKTVLGNGIDIKLSARQSYATDATYVSIVQSLCEKYNIPYAKFVNRSDMRGGSTLGNIISSNTTIPCVDIGVPILSMHSARELMACKDQDALCKLAYAIYSE